MWIATHHHDIRETDMVKKIADRPARFWSQVTQAGECWEWRGTLLRNGYGAFRGQWRTECAHRWAYEYMVDRIPEGLQLDHLCRNRRCVNPDHLEPVTQKVNIQRSFEARRNA